MFGLVRDALQGARTARENDENREFAADQMYRSYALNESSANAAMARQEAFYNRYLSPSARVRQLKAAGLSVGMMYSNGGGAGAFGSASSMPANAVSPLGASTTGFSIGQGDNMLTIAQARKANAEAEVIENKGEAQADANISLAKAKMDMMQSQEVLNKSLSNQADKQAEWQAKQTAIADLQLQIEQATKEDTIALAGKKLSEIDAAINWYNQQIDESKNRNRNRDKLTEEQAKLAHAQVYQTFAAVYEKYLGNKVTEATINELVNITIDTARKVAAEADNEENFQERFEREMEQRLRDNATTLEAAGIMAASGMIGGIGRMLGAGGMKTARGLNKLPTGGFGTYTKTTTRNIPGGKITEVTKRPIGYGGFF